MNRPRALSPPAGAMCSRHCDVPASPSAHVDRLRLTALLGHGVRLAAVIAPAGYGKTVLLTQWFRQICQRDDAVIWWSLEGAHGVATAVQSSCGRLAVGTGLPRTDRAGIVPDDLPTLLRGVSPQRPYTLFIDNLHRLPAPQAADLLRDLLRMLPSRCRLVVASRSRLPVDLDAMALDGSAIEITYDTLRFDPAEARDYLAEAVNDDEFALLQPLIEGWPVALRLCRELATGRGPANRSPQALAQALCGSDRLNAYFEAEVLRPLPAPVRDFITRLSILSEITADLAECLTESPAGSHILESLRRENLFLFPVPGRPSWLRLHPLFAGHLRSRHPAPQESSGDLHRKIAAWLLHRGLYTQALPHIQAVGDANFIARLLVAAGGWHLLFRGGATIARILHSLPLQVVRAYPALELARIYRLVHTGEIAQARQCFEELKARTDNFEVVADGSLKRADAIVMELLLSLYEDRTLGPQTLVRAETELRGDLDENGVRASVIRELLSWSLYHAGSFHKALSIGQESVDLCEREGIPYVQIYANLVIGLSELAEGRLKKAEGMYAHAESEAQRCFGEGCNQVMAARILSAEILLARNQVANARQCTAYWREAVDHGDGWVDLYASLYRTLSSSVRALGDGPAALDILVQARHMARERRLWRLEQILRNHQLREACLIGDAREADRLAAGLQEEHPRSASVLHQGWRVWYSRLLALARHALARGNLKACAAFLHDIDQGVFTGIGNHALCRLKRDLLEARMLFENGTDDYARPLARALMLAADSDLLRPVLDEGPAMLRMLRQYEDRYRLSRTVSQFVRSVQDQATREHASTPAPSSAHQASVPSAIAPGGTGFTADADLLSRRESEVLALICEGMTSKEIARRLQISVNTVLTHRKSLYRKLCATTRSQLMTVAREQQVLKPVALTAPYTMQEG